MRLLWTFAMISLAQGIPARSEESDPSKLLLSDFGFFCAANPGRPDKTIAAARVAKLLTVEPDILTAFGPQTPSTELQGWYLRSEPTSKTLLAISKTDLNGEPSATCTVLSTDALGKEVVAQLPSMIELALPEIDQTSFGNRMRLWQTEITYQPIQLILGNPTDDAIPGVTLGLVAKLTEN